MFEKNLRFYRLRKGLTKKALAEACSVTPMAISNYESGNRKPSMDVLEAIAAALDVRLADLLRRRNSSFDCAATGRSARPGSYWLATAGRTCSTDAEWMADSNFRSQDDIAADIAVLHGAKAANGQGEGMAEVRDRWIACMDSDRGARES